MSSFSTTIRVFRSFGLLGALPLLGSLFGCVAVSDESPSNEEIADLEATEESSDALVTVRYENKLALGRDHSCAIDASGALYCWGRNLFGQVGDGIQTWTGTTYVSGGDTTCEDNTTNESNCYANPKAVAGMGSGVTHVSAGWYHTCAIKSGQVYCWGRTLHGAVGVSLPEGSCGTAWTPTPTAISLPISESAIDIATGAYHSCALTSSGRVFCWGLSGEAGNPNGTHKFCGSLYGHDTPAEVSFPGVPTNVAAVTRLASGPTRSTTCAVHNDGGVSCWGALDEGANPDADNMGDFTPQPVVRNHGAANAARLTGASAAAINGSRGACALFAASGTVECWAPNSTTGCGRSTSAYSCTPEPAQVIEQSGSGTITLTDAAQLSGGDGTVCVMKSDNTPRCWGTNDQCIAGANTFAMPTARPLVNSNGSAILAGHSIVVGQQTSCVRRQDGTIYCLGADAQAEHGDGAPDVSHCSQNRGGGSLLMATLP